MFFLELQDTDGTYYFRIFYLLKNKQVIVLKSLNTTRWSRHAESCKSVIVNYEQILNILLQISEDSNEKADTRNEALSLRSKMVTFETAFMLTL